MMLKSALVLSAALAVDAFAVIRRGANDWAPPTSDDRRSPCPMVNTLANHGYLPRNGLNVSLADLITGFTAAVNLDPAATTLVGQKALLTSTTGNNATFNLDDLDKHGVIEHDGSLSRNDVYFGDNHSFDEEIWETVASHFVNETISIPTAAKARAARLQAAAAANPEFSLTADGVQFSFIETALYLSIFGNLDDGNAKTEWVKVLFQEERLPFAEGFTRSNTSVTAAGILGLVSKVAAASV
ncbi:putative sterigmatocystin biosynthesis peroxidase stcC [Colletotrichum sp. SAR 10_70]|nr:putative sterigmatocystin biosynthesis peroxidase stcC [Colletotrichum sp. SAR 10_71]KAI8155552.1 putative sterigmatocystin biosynthesis peroxidase stcC [Colletotrichum sp. SAR 10_70]KAI8243960.1 putative sterigmatocystin biosynthesis peroxidase stcC [Colletotrichum sp. SAR 10_77]KAJ4995884.1 putative sterigmatocystin biosynthesis peroxidase stcC [Colletotrichum sp. SAR 10_66]